MGSKELQVADRGIDSCRVGVCPGVRPRHLEVIALPFLRVGLIMRPTGTRGTSCVG